MKSRSNRDRKLSASMSLTQFDHGYWYATELKQFADSLGIPATARLRKEELERAIKQFLRSGTIVQPPTRNVRSAHAFYRAVFSYPARSLCQLH